MIQDNKHPQWNTPTPADRRVFPPEAVFEAGLRHHHIANTAYPIHDLGLGAQSLSHHTLSYNLGVEHFSGVVALFYAGAVKEYLIHLEGPGGSGAKAVRMPMAITAAQKQEV